MARAAVIPQSPVKQNTRGKKGTKGATGTASATARNAAREELSTGGKNSATGKTRGRTTKTQTSTSTTEPKKRTTRNKATSKKDNDIDSDDEETDDDDEIELISSKTQSHPPRGRKVPSSTSSSSKTTGRGKRSATPAAPDSVTDTETDDDELAQADAAPKKKQAGRPKAKKPSTAEDSTATLSSDAAAKPTRGRPKTAASKSASSATEKSGKGVTTRKQTRSQTATNTESPSEMDPKQVVITTGSSAAVKSNMLRGPAKKKKVTFHDVLDSEKENLSLVESPPAGRRRTNTASAPTSSTRRTGLHAKPTRNTTASSGRGRKSASSTTKKESPKPLSPKKTTQVAKSLSSYASSDGEDDELNCEKNQDPSPVKLVESSPTKHGLENNVGLGSPVRKVNLMRPDENDVFAHPAAAGPISGNPTGLSSPVRKINFTPNKQPPKSFDEDGEHSSRKINFKDSAFMSSPAKRPARSPFQYKIKESPRKCPIAINDTSKPASNQPSDFTPKHGSPLKSSPRKADLSMSLSQTPFNSIPTSTPFSARIRLFQSPAKRFPSPFPFKGSASSRSLFGSKSVEEDGDVDLSSSVCRAGPEESSRRIGSRKNSGHVADNGAKLDDSQHGFDAESVSEPEDDADNRSEVLVEKVATEEDGASERLEQGVIGENDLDKLEPNEDFQDGQEQFEEEACEGAIEDSRMHSVVDNGQDDVQEQDEEVGPMEDAQIQLDISDAHVQEEDREHGNEPLRLSGDEEDVQANPEVENVPNTSEVPLEPVDQNMEDGTDSKSNGLGAGEAQVPEEQQRRESVHYSDDVFVDDPVDDMAETPETPAKRRRDFFSESRNEPDGENDTFSEVGDFDFDDDPTLVASAVTERYVATPRRNFPYETNEDEHDGTSSIQRIRSNPPPAPSPPIRNATTPFAFRHRQASGGNVESDAEELSEAGSAMGDRNDEGNLDRSGSRTPLGHRTSGRKSAMEERRATLRQEGLRLTPLAQQFSQWNSGSPEKTQSRRPRRRGLFSLGASQRSAGDSSHRFSKFSRASSCRTRPSLAGSEPPLRELSVHEVTSAEPVSSVQKPETIQNDSSRDRHDIFSSRGNEETETREEMVEEMLSQQVDNVLDGLEPRREHSTNNAEIYCDENEEDPVTQNGDPAYSDLPVVEDYDDNKENENEDNTTTPSSVKKDVPSYPILAPETEDLDENKENHDDAPVLCPEPVTPSRNKSDDLLHVSHTVSKVPLKPEGQVSPLKISRKRGRSLSDTSPSRSSPRLRNRVLFLPPRSLTKSSSPSPRKLMRLEEPGRVSKVKGSESTKDENNKNVPSTMNSPANTPRRNVSESQQVLRGAVVFVDVHTTEGEDASGIFVELLQQMGAKCVRSWNWNPRLSISPPIDGADAKDNKVGITHIVYKDGGVRTLEKVRQAGGLVKCVGVGWVLDCERDNKWLDETDYAVDSSIIPRGGAKRRKSMEPLSLSNVNGTLVKTPARGRQSGAKVSSSTTSQDQLGTPENRRQWDSRYDNVVEDHNDTPRMFPTTPGGKDYDFSRLDDIGMSPATPYFLSAAAQRSKLVQQTCPPKQTRRGLFEDYYRMKEGVDDGEDGGSSTVLFGGDGDGDSGNPNRRLRDRLEASRRKSLAFKPKVRSPLAL